MQPNRFVLIHQDGQYLSINEGSHWICVRDPMAATVLTETKAVNILQNMIKPKEREHWQLQPYSQIAASAAQPPVENIPQEEVPELESSPKQSDAPAKSRRGRKKAAPTEPEQTATSSKKATETEPEKKPENSAPAKTPVRQHAKVVPAKTSHSTPVLDDPHPLVTEWMEKAVELKRQYENLIQRKKDLSEELRQVSAELCDLEHYIEFTSLNAAKGYRIYRRLRDCLIRRRKIKDELMCISIFLKAEPHNILNGNLYRQFNGLRSREYSPRVLEELFEDLTKETGSSPKKDQNQTQGEK